MEFDWNPNKRATVPADRGIDFVDLLVAFTDPDRVLVIDDRKDYGETRFNMLGKVNERVIHLTFTQRADVIWIITAWKANKREQRRYEQGQHDQNSGPLRPD